MVHGLILEKHQHYDTGCGHKLDITINDNTYELDYWYIYQFADHELQLFMIF